MSIFYESDAINAAVRRYNEAVQKYSESVSNTSPSPSPTGAAILVQVNTPRDYVFAMGSRVGCCSERLVADCVYANVAPEAINAWSGRAKTLVTASKDGNALPCKECLSMLGRKLFPDSEQTAFPLDMQFLAVDSEGKIKQRTTLNDLMKRI